MSFIKRALEARYARQYLRDSEEFQVLSAEEIDMSQVDNGEDD